VLHVREVRGRADRKAFIELPWRLHRHDPGWVPPLLISEWEKFDPRRNPFFDHGSMKLFLALRDGRVVGRIAAIDDENHLAAHGDNRFFFGFMEAEDAEVASHLLAEVEEEARRLARSAVRGPLNPTMNDGSGLQIDAFGTPPYVMMPFNPAGYPEWVAAAGYGKVMDLYAWHLDLQKPPAARITRIAERTASRTKAVIRHVDPRRLQDEARILKRIYDSAWVDNWGFVKYTDREFTHLVNELKLVLDPRIAIFVEINGEVVGAAIALPNINQVLARMNGRLLPSGIVHLLGRRRTVNTARLPILGVMPGWRNRGLELLLIDHVVRSARTAGYVGGECSWILETNHGMNSGIEATGAQLYKTYRLFEKPVLPAA